MCWERGCSAVRTRGGSRISPAFTLDAITSRSRCKASLLSPSQKYTPAVWLKRFGSQRANVNSIRPTAAQDNNYGTTDPTASENSLVWKKENISTRAVTQQQLLYGPSQRFHHAEGGCATSEVQRELLQCTVGGRLGCTALTGTRTPGMQFGSAECMH